MKVFLMVKKQALEFAFTFMVLQFKFIGQVMTNITSSGVPCGLLLKHNQGVQPNKAPTREATTFSFETHLQVGAELAKPNIRASVTSLLGFTSFTGNLHLFLLNSFGMVLVSTLADLTASIAERKRIQPNQWFIADIEREKKHYGSLRANRLFGHPLGKQKWF